jgi:hypothetical protein
MSRRVTVVSADRLASSTNFSHSAARISSTMTQSGPEALTASAKAASTRTRPPLQRPEDELVKLPRVADDTRRLHVGGHVDGAGMHTVRADHLGQTGGRAHAVLAGHDKGVGRQRRRRLRAAPTDVVILDHEKHDVGRTGLARIIRRAHLIENDVAQRAFDAQPLRAHRVQMRSARDERHIVPRSLKARAEVASERARAHHKDLHGHPLLIRHCRPGKKRREEKFPSCDPSRDFISDAHPMDAGVAQG